MPHAVHTAPSPPLCAAAAACRRCVRGLPAGCRWDKEEGLLKDSAPNELRQALPVLQVIPVTTQEYSLAGCYACPVYTNMQRANVYAPAVSTFTLRTAEPPAKWVLASVAVLLEDDLTAPA